MFVFPLFGEMWYIAEKSGGAWDYKEINKSVSIFLHWTQETFDHNSSCWASPKEASIFARSTPRQEPTQWGHVERRRCKFLNSDLLSLFQNESINVDDPLSSLSETSFNYINSIVGSGVIGIPYALVRAGYGVGLLLLVFVAVITDYSLRLMVNWIALH